MEFVKKALEEMQLGHEVDVTIIDYFKQKLNVDLGVTNNGKSIPIGFIQKNAEKIELQADWFKTPFAEKAFTTQLSQLHSKYNVINTCEENRWNIEDIVVNDAGEIEIIATQFA